MKINALNSSALFMSLLIISIPFYTSSVFADIGKISDVSVHGKEGVSDFVASSADYLEITLNVWMTDDDGIPIEVLPGYLRLSLNNIGSIPFSSCTGSAGSYSCTYQSEEKDWLSRVYDTRVSLYDSSMVLRLDKKVGEFYVDGSPPVFSWISIPDSATSEEFEISYSLVDSACSGCTGACSGIDRAELLVGDEIVLANEYEGGCSLQGEFLTSAASLNLLEGDNELCIRAYDKAGFYSEQCDSIFVDYNAPVFIADSFKILKQNNHPLLYSSLNLITADIYINISEGGSGLSVDDVSANLSALFTDVSGAYPEVHPNSCTTDGEGEYECIWDDISVHGIEGQGLLMFSAEDGSGNSASYTHEVSLPLDSGRPVVREIRTQNSGYVNRSNNLFVLEVTESGSGMHDAEAYLDLSRINSAYTNRKADNCTDVGSYWECYWAGISAAGLSNGDSVQVYVTRLVDDARISYLESEGETRATFTYDEEIPVLSNVTIRPYGSELEILMEGDVVEISAVVSDEFSGISEDRVYADLAGFDTSLGYMAAESCTRYGNLSTDYLCLWEYGGQLPLGEVVEIGITAYDNAGNVNEASESSTGSVFIAEMEGKEVDFWEEFAAVGRQRQLNENFLWQSSKGTIIRADVTLVHKYGMPYVHAFDVIECKGKLDISRSSSSGNSSASSDYEDYTIVGQYYYPGQARTSKYLLINIPNYDKELLERASKVEILCAGEVIQASSERGSVYSPNERFNATIDIPFMPGSLFTRPEFSTVNKINYKRDQVEFYDSVIEFIDGISSWLKPICTVVATIREVISNVCTLWVMAKTAFAAVTGGTSTQTSECALKDNFLETIWYGSQDDKMSIKDQLENPSAMWDSGYLLSSKKLMSMGYWCDLVLCQECNNLWNSFGWVGGVNDVFQKAFLPSYEAFQVKGKTASANGFEYPEKDIAAGGGPGKPSLYFDPQTNLIIAILCSPPCLTGIKNNLLVYKEIIVTYNVCMNTAAIRGSDTSQCDDYYSSQVCQQIIGMFWGIIEQFIMQLISKTIMYYAENWIFNRPECRPGATNVPNDPTHVMLCVPTYLMAVASFWMNIEDSIEKFEELGELDFKSEEEVQSDIDADMELSEEELMQKYGTFPSYGS
ncbi:hypothetical protein JXB31_04065 [Candidatus Woesearchaeota archaeon]|nr:hypothetical protein [Candidatus Woesearchaeota archaeon]